MRFRRHGFCEKMSCSKVWCAVGGALIGLLVIVLCLSGFSLLTANLDASDSLVSCMAGISLCAGSFAAGFRAASHRRKHGVFMGIACGLLIYFVVFFFGLVLLGSIAGAGTFMKLVLILLCSAIGGVCGVNKRHCRPPR